MKAKDKIKEKVGANDQYCAKCGQYHARGEGGLAWCELRRLPRE